LTKYSPGFLEIRQAKMLINCLELVPTTIPFLFEGFFEFEIFGVYFPLDWLLIRVSVVS